MPVTEILNPAGSLWSKDIGGRAWSWIYTSALAAFIVSRRLRTFQNIVIRTLFDGTLPHLFDQFCRTLLCFSNWGKVSSCCVEHLIGWRIACAIEYDTLDEVLKLLEEIIIFCFAPPKTMISDNERFFIANKIQSFIKDNNMMWKTVIKYPRCPIGEMKEWSSSSRSPKWKQYFRSSKSVLHS